jgi:hypothetical protein
MERLCSHAHGLVYLKTTILGDVLEVQLVVMQVMLAQDERCCLEGVVDVMLRLVLVGVETVCYTRGEYLQIRLIRLKPSLSVLSI